MVPASPLSLLCRTCRFFETLSYLPPLTDEAIAKQARASMRANTLCGSEGGCSDPHVPCTRGAEPRSAQLTGVTEAFCWRPQVDYITRNGWTPCLEFSEADQAYVKDNFTGAPRIWSYPLVLNVRPC